MNDYSNNYNQPPSGGSRGGGPPLGLYQQQITGCNNNLFNQIQDTINCNCANGGDGGKLCTAMHAGQILSEQPYSSMVNLIDNYSNCQQTIPLHKKQLAYQVFKEVTGYTPPDLTTVQTSIDDDFNQLINITSFYMYGPTLVLAILIIWLMVGFRWITWEVGLFFTILCVVVLYGFNIAYRLHTQAYLRSRSPGTQQNTAATTFQDSIAYWPQALFAVASAVSSPTGTDAWICNNNTASNQSQLPNNPPYSTTATNITDQNNRSRSLRHFQYNK